MHSTVYDCVLCILHCASSVTVYDSEGLIIVQVAESIRGQVSTQRSRLVLAVVRGTQDLRRSEGWYSERLARKILFDWMISP